MLPVLLFVVVYAAACVGDDAQGSCPVADACDIRGSACQQRVYDATACIAELEPSTRPPVRTIGADEFAAELRMRRDSATVDPEEQSWNQALQLVGLLPPGMTASDAADVVAGDEIAAYYDNDSKRVTIIDRGTARNPQQDLLVLSHELSHALRDHATDLTTFRQRYGTSTDSFVAVSSLVEGEAMVISLALVARSMGPNARVLWGRAASMLDDSVLESVDGSALPFVSALQGLPYAFGTRRLGPSWELHGREVTDALFEAPDLSLLQWTFELGDGPSPGPLTCFPTSPPAGYIAVDSDTLGLAAVLTLPVALGVRGAQESVADSRALRDDRMVVFRPEDPNSTARAVAWRLHFDSAGHAEGFGEAVGCCLPNGTKRAQDGRDVIIFAATDPAIAAAWPGALACGAKAELPSSGRPAMDMAEAHRRLP